MQRARQQRWRTSRPTSWVLPPTRSRRRALRPPDTRSMPAASSAGGNASSFRMRSASSSSTISGCETTAAGRCSTARDSLAVGLAEAALVDLAVVLTRQGGHELDPTRALVVRQTGAAVRDQFGSELVRRFELVLRLDH